jgi:hypothetical protein
MPRTIEELADCIERASSGDFELWCTPAEWLTVTGRVCDREKTLVMREDFCISLERRFGHDAVWEHNCFPVVVLVVGRLQCAGGDRYAIRPSFMTPIQPYMGPVMGNAIVEYSSTTVPRKRWWQRLMDKLRPQEE